MLSNIFISIAVFAGRLHPVLVHLPIGILLLAALFHLFSPAEKRQALYPAISLALFWGMLSAASACISGFLLSRSGDYELSAISGHQWSGIGVLIVSALAWYLNKQKNKQLRWVLMLLVLLIVIAGHLGGSITHGADYLTGAFGSNETGGPLKREPIANIQEAVVYTDLVQPVLAARCYGCHGPKKQKGKLRLDSPDLLMKGGKDGKVLIPGKADESNLMERILLPLSDEDHMPPKEKPQLSRQDIELLNWWINGGADFTRKVREYSPTPSIKPILAALQSGGIQEEAGVSAIPSTPVRRADTAAIRRLTNRGVVVLPVAQNSHYLSANFVAVDSVTINDLLLLEPVKEQLVWLKAGGAGITDAGLEVIGRLGSLTRLYLEKNPVTDRGIAHLKNLAALQYLNLGGTGVKMQGLEQLKSLKNLQHLYLYQTPVYGTDWTNLQRLFPKTEIDTGGYIVPVFESDTTLFKKKNEDK